MRRAQITDLFLNVLFPILMGAAIYFVAGIIVLNKMVRDQLPDGLWAYSLISCVLIIWKREINTSWLIAVFVFFILIELLQSFHIINGTGDYLDVVSYFVFSLIALFANKYFLITFKSNV